jgi:prepilin-type N-terminal cleavage/methylation domain-containing protein
MLKNGFTLIELLVVVLIIGILAAIAVPQYQTAVLKTRFATVIANTRAVKDAAEIYYMTYGDYPTDDITVLDFDIPDCVKYAAGLMRCPKTNTAYNYNGNNSTGQAFDVRGYYPESNGSDGKLSLDYTMVLDHAQSNPGKIYCRVGTNNQAAATRVCKSMCKTPIVGSVCEI